MNPTTIKFVWDKETQNAQRFVAPKDSGISGSLYVSKEQAGDRKEISVSVSFA